MYHKLSIDLGIVIGIVNSQLIPRTGLRRSSGVSGSVLGGFYRYQKVTVSKVLGAFQRVFGVFKGVSGAF